MAQETESPVEERIVAANDPVLPGVPRPAAMPSAAVAQFPFPEEEPPEQIQWTMFARYDHCWDGQIIAGLLENEGVPAQVVYQWIGPDLLSFSWLFVPAHLVHRARWILSWDPPSEAELVFLATGELEYEVSPCRP